PRARGRRTLAGPLPSPPGLRLHGPGAVDGGEPRPPDPALRGEPGRGNGTLPREAPAAVGARPGRREAAGGRDALGHASVPIKYRDEGRHQAAPGPTSVGVVRPAA